MTIAFLITGLNLNAQELQGTAYYKTKRKVEIKLDSTSATSIQQEQLNAILKRQFEKEYVLNFNKTASTYKEVESLGDASSSAGGGVRIVAFGAGGSGNDVLYKDTRAKTYTNQRESFSKQFLIKDSLQKVEWKLENETKQIGNYTCYKATFEREVERRQLNFNDAEEEEKTVKETIVTTAWYTPQIPVSHGPERHWGLPGLILEINDGNSVMICNKIVMNPKEKIEIIEPKKGKKVTQEEFNEVMRKKAEEMSKIYGGGRKKGNGQSIQIKIGG
ncbi:GLPGLI family protein [Leptobacterium flavescens]|uniref:GLPGLI family protein n=1 Tax=Leptobacterium flavescens TaxID=472055 RepID=UPI001EF75C71|nr:GLPGLI family protein [Leptobacterium flavescens]